MLNNTTLLSLYKQEKADMYMPSEDFPPFKEWKAEYMVDWEENHKVTDEDEAMEEADRLVAEADKELRKRTKHVKPKKKAKVTSTKIIKPKVKKHSKKQDAVKVYQSMMTGDTHPARKDVIQAFVDNIGLSIAGSSTYHHNIKKEFLEGKHK